jgi:hypothetical protein
MRYIISKMNVQSHSKRTILVVFTVLIPEQKGKVEETIK